MSLFKGSGTALVTPFTESGVDFKKLEELVEWQIKHKTDALIVCGTTGEASTMSESERKETIKFVVDIVKKRIPVIAGTGSNNTAASLKMSQWAESIGADGVLLITPYYNKTTQKGLVAHFGEIAANINIPIILYNVPSRTGVNLLPATIAELTKFPNIVAVKEACGDISQIANIRALCGTKIDIYSGNDDQIVPILSLGGSGVISVASNIIPTEIHDICEYYFNGDLNKSLEMQIDYLSLINSLFIEVNPIPVKVAMNMMNMKVGPLRLPLIDMSDSNKEILKKELSKKGLI